GQKFHLPTAKDIDAKLVIGAALFGTGWGLSGFCPGPAMVSLSTGSTSAMIFVVAMLLGMALHRTYHDLRSPSQ
ncbi:MAG TPA: YeeE/YedE thiosulfate transporter family protein, partial [Pseudomonadota bacterium]|nr:YeeE/YedE thiosulfate transporter family protein [Pseudomonadota bacterium]